MEGEKKIKKEIKKVMRTGATSSKTEQWKGTTAITTTVSSLAKEVKDISIVGLSRTCSNRRSREDEYSNIIP